MFSTLLLKESYFCLFIYFFRWKGGVIDWKNLLSLLTYSVDYVRHSAFIQYYFLSLTLWTSLIQTWIRPRKTFLQTMKSVQKKIVKRMWLKIRDNKLNIIWKWRDWPLVKFCKYNLFIRIISEWIRDCKNKRKKVC